MATLAEPYFAIPILLAVGVLLFMVNMGGYPLYTKGEPREAVTILDIYNGGGVILPMRAGVEIPSKPLLMHWMGALASLAMGGVSMASVRMPSALLAIAGMIVCYLYMRMLFDPLPAFLSALILGTTFQYLQAGTGARVDMTLTFFMEVAFFEFLAIAEGLTKRRMLLYVAIALAVLAKGPVGVVLPGAVGLVWIMFGRRWDLFKELRLVRGTIVVLLLAGWWYVAASIVGGTAFIHTQIIDENLVRFFGAKHFHEGHVHPFYYLDLALMAGFLPWTPLLALVLERAWRSPRKMEPRLMYLVAWPAVVLLFYSFAVSKRGVYLLSLYPALAGLVALYIADAIRNPASSERLLRILSRIAGIFFVGVAAIAGAGLVMLWLWPGAMAAIFEPFGITYAPFTHNLASGAGEHLALSIVIPTACLAVGIFLLRTLRPTAERMSLGLAAGMIAIVIAANMVVVPAIADTLALKNFSAKVLAVVGNQPVAYFRAIDYDVAFYTGRTIPVIHGKDKKLPEYLIVWDGIYHWMGKRKRDQYRVVLKSNPTSLAGTGRMLLLKRVTPAGSPPAPTPPSSPTSPKTPKSNDHTV